MLPEHAERIRKIVDDTIEKLDQLMDGAIKRDDWLLYKELVTFIYPDEVRGVERNLQRNYQLPK